MFTILESVLLIFVTVVNSCNLTFILCPSCIQLLFALLFFWTLVLVWMPYAPWGQRGLSSVYLFSCYFRLYAPRSSLSYLSLIFCSLTYFQTFSSTIVFIAYSWVKKVLGSNSVEAFNYLFIYVFIFVFILLNKQNYSRWHGHNQFKLSSVLMTSFSDFSKV